jgi:LmbE family N-acetylglucosaminyl deacetylase
VRLTVPPGTSLRSAAAGALCRTAEWWRRILAARGRDGADLAGRRLMVLAPHPDDETLGCGATIAQARAGGSRVTVVVATDGRHSGRSLLLSPEDLAAVRAAELHSACAALGVGGDHVHQLGYHDGTLRLDPDGLASRLAGLFVADRPDVVLMPCAQDQHVDHAALHLAARRAAVALPAVQLLSYPVWTWIRGPWFLDAPALHRPALLGWAIRQASIGRWVRVGTGGHLTAKRTALGAYASQTTNYTGEPTWSYLPPEYLSLFLRADELFLPVYPR